MNMSAEVCGNNKDMWRTSRKETQRQKKKILRRRTRQEEVGRTEAEDEHDGGEETDRK